MHYPDVDLVLRRDIRRRCVRCAVQIWPLMHVEKSTTDLTGSHSWESFLDRLLAWRDAGVKLRVTVEDYEKIRSLPQNSRYWATLTELLREIAKTVTAVSEHSGYSPREVKKLMASTLTPEQTGILFARKPELAHEVVKQICDVPTSTRLGTKKFMEFEERMIQEIATISGEVAAFKRLTGS